MIVRPIRSNVDIPYPTKIGDAEEMAAISSTARLLTHICPRHLMLDPCFGG